MIANDDVVVLAELDDDGGYDWETVQVGRGTDGRLYFRAAAGCSCSWIGEEPWEELNNYAGVERSITSWREWSRARPSRDACKRAEFRIKVTEIMRSELTKQGARR